MAYDPLLNSELGEPFAPFRDDGERIVARAWAPWWLPANENDPDWQNRAPVFGGFSLDGRSVQQLSTPFATHTAGLWQQVPTAAGNEYELTVEGQAWSSEDAAPASQLEASDVNMQVGVDPTGGTDPTSPLVIWSELSQPLSRWETLRLNVKAEAPILTLYLKSAPTLPKRQQAVFWRNAHLRPIGRHKRSLNIVGSGDTHISLEPERPFPGDTVEVTVSSTRSHRFVELQVTRPDEQLTLVQPLRSALDDGRNQWQYRFVADQHGLYELRFLGDRGARLLSLRLLQIAQEVQIVPTDSVRTSYKKVYVLLPPTADLPWLLAAARGSYPGRFTIGFSADDAGMGTFENKRVVAVNPHHWPDVLTVNWFEQHYPGVQFTPLVANAPADLEAWLKNWVEVD